MGSKFWNENLAQKYREFRCEFAERALVGKTVIVAGGSGGLGAATVALLAREGARVICGYRANRERAEALAGAMRRQFKAELTLVGGDIGDAAVRHAYVEAARAQQAAPLQASVIFPGDPGRVPLEQLDRDSMHASLDANYVGPMLLARDLGAAMEQAGGGSVVLLATMQALGVFPGSVNYAAPKAALVQGARILARTWSKVRVNVVAPGATVAGMAESSVSAGKYDSFVESGAIPRFGRPEDVARAVRFFLEPDNYVTGQVLLVDGGLTLKK